jgi:hypothetical protein
MDQTERPGLSPITAALLVGGPLLMVIGRLLLVPLDDQRWDAVLTHAAAHQNRSDAGWLIAMASAGLIGASAFALATLVRRAGRTKAAAVATVTTALGWAGCAGLCTAGLLLSYQGKAPDRAVQVKLLTDVNAGHTSFVFLLCVLAAIGYVVLAVGLARTHVVGKGIAILIAVGGVGTLLTMPGPAKPLLVFAALVLLAGQTLVVKTVGVTTPTTPVPAWEPISS